KIVPRVDVVSGANDRRICNALRAVVVEVKRGAGRDLVLEHRGMRMGDRVLVAGSGDFSQPAQNGDSFGALDVSQSIDTLREVADRRHRIAVGKVPSGCQVVGQWRMVRMRELPGVVATHFGPRAIGFVRKAEANPQIAARIALQKTGENEVKVA